MQNKKLSLQSLRNFRDYLLREEKSMATVEKYFRDVCSFLDYVGEKIVTKEITIAYNKSKTRTVLLPQSLIKELSGYIRKRGIKEGTIFVTRKGNPLDRSNIWADMKKLCCSANVNPSKVFPHNLRKLFARTFYGIEKDIAKLADILGHGNIETTRIYIMTTGSEHRQKIECLGLVFHEIT